VDVSTDLGVSYYYANQADRALAQFDRSLAIDPRHTKTMLNIGVVRAFGKQDLAGAAKIWQQVVDLAPESAEGRAARRMIEAVRTAHPETGGAPVPAGPRPPAPQGGGS
jgi:cytochrome c-type biogenesis protein CcmH/NrfG